MTESPSLMKHLLRAALFSAFFAAPAFAQDVAVATVRFERTEPVSGRQLDETVQALEQQQGRKLTLEERRAVLDQMIDQILIVQAAEADRSITVSDEEIEQAGMRLVSQQLTVIGAIPPGAVLTDKAQYRQVVEQQGVSLQEFEATVRKQILAEKYITSVDRTGFQSIPPAAESELNAEYQRRVSEFSVSDSVWFNQIFFDTGSTTPAQTREKNVKAKDVLRRLENTSVSFADMAALESEDDDSKARGGLTGPLMRGDGVAEQLYGPEFIDAVFALKVGDLSAVLKSNVGYHIVEITEKKAAQLLPRDDPQVKTYLEQIIYAAKYQKKFDEAASRILKDLRSRSTINYFGDYR